MKIESEKEKKLDTALNKLITLDLKTNLKENLESLDLQKNQLEIEKKKLRTGMKNLLRNMKKLKKNFTIINNKKLRNNSKLMSFQTK